MSDSLGAPVRLKAGVGVDLALPMSDSDMPNLLALLSLRDGLITGSDLLCGTALGRVIALGESAKPGNPFRPGPTPEKEGDGEFGDDPMGDLLMRA